MLDFREDTIKKVNDRNKLFKADMSLQDPAKLFDTLIAKFKKYRPNEDTSKIVEAYSLAKRAHKGQRRKSGEDYIIHPLHVANILVDLEMDQDSIVAGLLHDVVEDTPITRDEILKSFGEDVADIVDGVTKLSGISFNGNKEEQQAENLRKMFLAMANDIRVVIIKLADRTHNMRTLQFMTPEKQQEKARETLDIYSPLADRLGIGRLKIELDNLSLAYLEPEAYNKLVLDIDNKKGAREEYIEHIVNDVEDILVKSEVTAEVYGRVKHYFSIYKKMVTQNKSVDEIYDIFAVRIIVESVEDCYKALGLIHERYTPIPKRFKDYIAMPKPNNYQSLHTTLIGDDGIPFEIQIRTREMHEIAEYGVAAHWKYKEDGSKAVDNEEQKFTWLRQILEWQKEMPDDAEFLLSVKNDLNLFAEKVYCFTPSGDIKQLPSGSTPVDFAYMIHSAVGNKMVGARVNEKLVTIDYQLKTGDRVEIITSQNSNGPSRDWLKICRTSQARSKINQWFRAQDKEENIERGKEALETNAKAKGYELPELTKQESVEKILRKYGYHDWTNVLAAVGQGGLKEGQVINFLVDEKEKGEKKVSTNEEVLAAIAENKKAPVRASASGIVVEGIDDISVHMAKCCNPIPGDEIVGFITRGRGISIHRTDCINLLSLNESERARTIEAQWAIGETSKDSFVAQVSIYVNNRNGLLADISRVFAEADISITAIRTAVNKQEFATVIVDFEISGIEGINAVIQKLKQIPDIVDVERTTG